MANIIDNTYFIGDIQLPIDDISAKLTNYIVRLEPEILTKVLGYDLKKLFVDALAGVPEQKYIDLNEGKDYQVDGIWYNWRGLKNTSKESLIAYYVWYKFVTTDNTYVSGAGIKQALTENSQFTNPRFIQVQNYNKMVDFIAEMDKFINANLSDYPTYKPELIGKINIFNI